MVKNKAYNIKLYDLQGNFVATFSPSVVKTPVSFQAQLSGGLGELTVGLDLPIDSASVAYNRIVKVYQSDDAGNVGRLIYGGVVTSVKRVSDRYGEYVELRANGYQALLARTLFSSGGSYAFAKNQEPKTTLQEIVDDFATKYPGTLSYTASSIETE